MQGRITKVLNMKPPEVCVTSCLLVVWRRTLMSLIWTTSPSRVCPLSPSRSPSADSVHDRGSRRHTHVRDQEAGCLQDNGQEGYQGAISHTSGRGGGCGHFMG
jgi:hypothetical protein